jgi:hypothetical protein
MGRRPKGVPVYTDGKIVGMVRGEVFEKKVTGSYHFLKYPPAIACNEDALIAAQSAGALILRVIDVDTGVRYEVGIDRMLSAPKLNRGHGEQRYLGFASFAMTSSDQGKLF